MSRMCVFGSINSQVAPMTITGPWNRHEREGRPVLPAVTRSHADVGSVITDGDGGCVRACAWVCNLRGGWDGGQ